MLTDSFIGIMQRAGEMMLQADHPEVRRKDGHANFVTATDEAVQAFLLENLHQLVPSAHFLAEEGSKSTLTDALTFVIDPIDGTTNFFRGRKASAVSVGLTEGKRAVAGAIWNPYSQCFYQAERGQGAFCNGRVMHVSEFEFGDALIELGTSPYRTDLNHVTARSVESLLPRIADLRRSGAAVVDLCRLAGGHSEGMFEWNLQPWDYCAGSLLVEEAGGKTGNILGGETTFEEGIPFMAANAKCFGQLQSILQEVRNEENL